MNLSKKNKGFTLIEILLVVAILAILLVVVFASLNPAQRLEDTRDARRWNDVNQVLTSLHECIIDNDAVLASCGVDGLATDGTVYEIVDAAVGAAPAGCIICGGAANCVDLETDLQGTYLGSLPKDPGGGTGGTPAAGHTHYCLTVNAAGIYTVSAANYEGTSAISVSR